MGVIQSALTALGGIAAIQQQGGTIIEAQLNSANSNLQESGKVTWHVTGKEVRVEYVGSSHRSIIVTGHGKPKRATEEISESVAPHVVKALIVPPLVAQMLEFELASPSYDIRTPSDHSDSSTHDGITVETRSHADLIDLWVTKQIWSFDSSSGLPAKLEYFLPDKKDSRKTIRASAEFSDYRQVSGILFPYTILIRHRDALIYTISVQSISIHNPINPSIYDLSSNGGEQ